MKPGLPETLLVAEVLPCLEAPLGKTKIEPIDRGTLNRQRSQPPGPSRVLRHRYVLASELGYYTRTLLEFAEIEFEIYGTRITFPGYRLPDLSPVLLMENPAFLFRTTRWEKDFGLTPVNSGLGSSPVVNSSNEVVGHVARFRNDEIFVPKMLADIKLSDVVDSGMPAFVRSKNPNPDSWRDAWPPQTTYQLLTSSGGEVVAVLGSQVQYSGGSQSTWEYIKTVVLIADGWFLVRSFVPAAGRAVVAGIEKRIAKRALAAAERERLKVAGKWVAEGKDVSPAAFERTGVREASEAGAPAPPSRAPEAFADTEQAAGATRNTGDFANAAEESALEERIGAMHKETWAEIERVRATKSWAEAEGDAWMEEVSEIVLRVKAKWFPKGLHLPGD